MAQSNNENFLWGCHTLSEVIKGAVNGVQDLCTSCTSSYLCCGPHLSKGEGSRDLICYLLFLSASHVVSSIQVQVVAQYFGNEKEQIILLAF